MKPFDMYKEVSTQVSQKMLGKRERGRGKTRRSFLENFKFVSDIAA